MSAKPISESDSTEATKLLKVIGDFERIADHSVNILESAEELKTKNQKLTDKAEKELNILTSAVGEIIDNSLKAFLDNDLNSAAKVEPLEQVIDSLKEKMRTNHILRLQEGKCSVDVGFVWSDILTNLERTSDHCSNIAGCVTDIAEHNMNIHESLRDFRNDSEEFRQQFKLYKLKYSLPNA